MIAIIDYGMGNIHSVQKALEVTGGKTLVTNKPADIMAADKLVLPGVGAFDDAMKELNKRGLTPILQDQVKRKPFLGICLGMQLLFDTSEEAKDSQGLGIIKGRVRRFDPAGTRKVPHMGWNQIIVKRNDCPLLSGIAPGEFVYFCHSYYPVPDEDCVSAASCDYGAEFCCVAQSGMTYGVQFHPEKSQAVGLRIVKNFVQLKCS